MQRPFRHFWIVSAVFIAAFTACYSHTGQPYRADDAQWRQLATEACERGDLRAYEALLQRSGLPLDNDQCPHRDTDEDTTSGNGF